ncbi:MAG: TetR family transcriptional regulator [Synergistaceae bacterium]|nr:TetR family transcriptional regulator [Synergistaceae bacterium]
MARKTKEFALETREKLLESALGVMSEKPFDKVSLSEIASRVGLSKGAVYWHFKNKSDLLVSLLRQISESVGLHSRGDEDPPEDFEGLRRFFRDKLKGTDNNERMRKINKLFHRGREWPDDVHSVAKAFIREITKHDREIIAGVILRCQEKNEVRSDFPANEIAALLFAIFHGIFFLQMNEMFSMDFAKYTNFLFDALEKELKSGPGGGPDIKNTVEGG